MSAWMVGNAAAQAEGMIVTPSGSQKALTAGSSENSDSVGKLRSGEVRLAESVR